MKALAPMQRLGLAAGLGSAALLAGALASQVLWGLAPCPLCIWQRWPHVAAALLGLAIAVVPRRILAALGALAALTSAGIALYHVGIEQRWWQGPDSCVAPDISGLSPAELLDRILAAPVVRCDDIAWSFAGISMAGWNGLLSLALAAVWIAACRAGGPGYASSSASQ